MVWLPGWEDHRVKVLVDVILSPQICENDGRIRG
jgi:hypothetical protein